MCQPDSQRPSLTEPAGSGSTAVSAVKKSLVEIFTPKAREVEENIELYFSDLAAASETHAGELFDDETHANFYLASREVISQGLENQLAFLRDNAPQAFAILLRRAGVTEPHGTLPV